MFRLTKTQTTSSAHPASSSCEVAARVAGLLALSALALLMSGCGMGSVTKAVNSSSLSLHGMAQGGQQPVYKAHIALYATTGAQYGGAGTLLSSTMTDKNGNWSLSSDYDCPSGQQAYIVATGGNPGLDGDVDNSAIFLVAALGPCTSVNSNTFVILNEVTTVAAAYALAGFAPAGGAGMTSTAVTAGFDTSTSNAKGLADAFANAANIVDSSRGIALATPASTADGVAPQAMINTLADILQSCVNSEGPGSTPCSSLFTAAMPPVDSGIAAPVNTLQAILDIAAYPANASDLYKLIAAEPAFSPTLGSQPNDWTLSISYTGGQLASAQGLAIDDADNVWVSGSTSASLVEFSPQGLALSPAGGWLPAVQSSTDLVRNLAFDTSGQLWLADGSVPQVYQYTPASSTLNTIFYTSAYQNLAPAYNLGVSASGDVWLEPYVKKGCSDKAASYCAFTQLQKSGSTYTPNSTFGGSAAVFSAPGKAMAVDANSSSPGYGNVWFVPNSTDTAQILAAPYAAAPLVATMSSTGSDAPQAIALDANGDAWIATYYSGLLFEVSPQGTLLHTATSKTGLSAPNAIAVDGAGNLFLANYGNSTIAQFNPAFSSGEGAFVSPGTGFNPGATYNASKSKYMGGQLSSVVQVAVDRSGALWALNQGTGSIVQVLGLAVPTRPVLAFGQYGKRP